jgi:hypothetical protein
MHFEREKIPAFEQHGSGRRHIPVATHEEKSECGLAGSIRSEERVDLLRIDREIELIENGLMAHLEGEFANV